MESVKLSCYKCSHEWTDTYEIDECQLNENEGWQWVTHECKCGCYWSTEYDHTDILLD